MTLLGPFPLDAKTFEFEWLRRVYEVALWEGVPTSDLKVTDGAGADLKVDVAGGQGFVRGDTGFRNGLYLVVNDAAIANAVTLDASHATLPRIDQVVLRVNDTDDLASATDIPAIEKVTGVPTSGATLDNRNGATALPDNCLRLADVLVPAAATSLLAANIRDRRPWCRGIFWQAERTAGNLTATGTTLPGTELDTAALKPRIETSGPRPVKMTCTVRVAHSVSTSNVRLVPLVDGVSALPGAAGTPFHVTEFGGTVDELLHAEYIIRDLAPGSHLFSWAGSSTIAGTQTYNATADMPLRMTVEEIQKQGSGQYSNS